MIIRNVNKFLAGAVIVASSATAYAHEGNLSLSQMQFNPATAEMHTLNTPNISGEQIKLFVPKNLSQKTVRAGRFYNTDHYNVMNTYKGQKICTVLFDADRLANPQIHTQTNLFSLVDRNSYMYGIISHELSHCIGVSVDDAKHLSDSILKNPALKDYDVQAKNMASAMRETHADLAAVLLGASKTGDWTVLNRYLIPERTKSFNPEESTILAVTDLIKDINPKSLEGKSFVEVIAVTNKLFTDNAYVNGKLDAKSNIGLTIMKTWYAAGLENKISLRYYAEKNEYTAATEAQIELHRQFGERIIGKEALKQRNDVARYFGIKAYGLEQQNDILSKVQGVDRDKLENLNEIKIANLDFILEGADHLHHGPKATIKSHRKAIEKMVDKYHDKKAPQKLEMAVPNILQEAVTNQVLGNSAQKIEKNIQNRLSSVLLDGKVEHNTVTSKGLEIQSKTKLQAGMELVV